MQTRYEKRYNISFINDCIIYYYIYLFRRKDETLEMFKYHDNKVENQLDRKINVIRSGRGEANEACNEFCFQNSIIHQTTTPYSFK
jgi:hypothetical protein